MNADHLLAEILARPDEDAARLVRADWLEERGDSDSLLRTGLVRLEVQWRRVAPAERAELEAEFVRQLNEECPGIAGPLQGLIRPRQAVLGEGAALVLCLTASLAAVAAEPAVGSVWEGTLIQSGRYHFPTRMEIKTREGNEFTGHLDEDFASLYGQPTPGRFYFHGLVAGRHLAFVTHGGEGPVAIPGLYQAELKHGGWIIGTWAVPRGGDAFRGPFRLRRKRPRQEE